MAERSEAGGRASAEGPSLPRPQKPSDRFPESRISFFLPNGDSAYGDSP